MHPVKYLWALRALTYKAILGSVGRFTYIGKPVFIEGRAGIKIGSRTRIFPGIRMEAIGEGTIEIGINVAIEQNVHITCEGGVLRIGDNTTVAANTFITNIDHVYEDITKSVMEQGLIQKETIIGEGCFLGYGVAIQAGTRLGKHCVVGANSVVKGDFPDYSVIVGVPGRIIKKYNIEIQEWERVR